MSSPKPVLVVAGFGAGGGTGAAAARAFAKEGYTIALIGRRAGETLLEELKNSGADVRVLPSSRYRLMNTPPFNQHSKIFDPNIHPHNTAFAPRYITLAMASWKPFLDVTPEDIKGVTETNIDGAFAFAHEVITEFKKNEIDPTTGKRGVLIFTGATASIRGNVTTSAFSAGMFALRALSQSLAKEFGKQNIHVAHAIIDGAISTPLSRERRKNPEWEQNEDVRLSPEAIASTYIHLAKQERSAWTWELDLRPAHEKW
ncbi:NAD(P)-binding protein [Gymnopus androsaceus JB14]|uniref:NAD(P)-binding protein n=1 Tax=Gymnopus androsaceus JB14 TaxID=1447944 RepID=A0A6A4I0B7_9AGAR|nr:NAD(P)-binding protein [Gymnopus androsaceus JB14]